MAKTKRLNTIMIAIVRFIGEYYGETPDNACYDIEALAKAIEKAIEESDE